LVYRRSISVAQGNELHPSNAQVIAGRKCPALDPLAIDERAVGAVEIL
jgi:hypothetical protein